VGTFPIATGHWSIWSRRYAVTVMDNWTPMRLFWTLKGAQKFASQHQGYAHVYERCGLGWRKST
jgi:hypothetical protein